jgi:hypothetical protein
METDLNKFSVKKVANVQETIKENGAPVTSDLDLVKNKKDVIGSVWVEHDTLKITEEQLKTLNETFDNVELCMCLIRFS